MKVLFIILFVSTFILGQSLTGIIKEHQTIKSEILGKEVRYTIYLPYDYETSERNYPVVYLLHGYTGSDIDWIQFGEANLIADEAIAKREIPPMILVTPDAENSWYINNYDGSVKYEDFFIKEFIPFIESHYRIRKSKRFRALCGLSMGGYGSLNFAFKYPELFDAAAPLSAAVYTEEQILNFDQKRWDRIEGILYGKGLKGKERLTKTLIDNNPLFLLNILDPEKIKQVRFYLDCGDDDRLTFGNCELHLKMTRLGIPHEFRMRDGAHNWTYWRTGLLNALKFIGDSFHSK